MPRIYADFNGWDGSDSERWLNLLSKGTFDDLDKLGVELREGLEVVFYDHDEDEKGNPTFPEADGVVRFLVKNNHWIGVIDWNKVRRVPVNVVAQTDSASHLTPASKQP